MTRNSLLGASLLLSVALGLSIIAQTNFRVIPSAYAQNMTPKMHLEEGIKALKGGDSKGAMMHLDAAEQGLTSASDQSAKMHLDQGIQALKSGDNQGATMHLDAADQALK
jgi:hypothetical protein